MGGIFVADRRNPASDISARRAPAASRRSATTEPIGSTIATAVQRADLTVVCRLRRQGRIRRVTQKRFEERLAAGFVAFHDSCLASHVSG